MRPRRLEVEGYTAFRDRTVVDFEGADLFAFTGPTGSGKSSLVDAMVFALYGSVPRLDRRLVAPVVSLGRNEARVRLDFAVGDDAYTAVRVVRRTKSGATTKEARLEGPGGTVLAGNEKELTEAVEGLLGLGFEHFTTCVVLPQGDFARLLHDEPRKRQDLLVSLLDLGLYERMGQLARARDQAARQQAELAAALLARLAFATPEARAAAAGRHERLVALAAEVDRQAPVVDALLATERAAAAEAAEADGRAALLAAVAVPAGVADRAAAVAAAGAAVVDAERAESEAAAAVEMAEAALRSLPRRDVLEAAVRAHDERGRHLAQQEKGLAVLAERLAGEAAATAAAVAAEAAAAEATAVLDRARWEHRAADLAAGLVPGEPCPVCRQPVDRLIAPADEGAAGAVRAAEVAARRAAAEVERARRAAVAAERDRLDVEAKLASIAEQLAALDAVLAEHPDREAAQGALADVAAAHQAWEAASTRDRQARRAAVQARQALDRLRGEEAADRRAFDEVRDRVAALGPPAPGRTDLAADWAALAAWATERAPAERAGADAARARADAAAAERAAVAAELAERCAAEGVAVADGAGPRGPVAAAVAGAAAEVARIDEAAGQAAAHRADLAGHEADARLAGALAAHLSARGFEKWVLDEAVAALTAGATELLRSLSAGAYSLAVDDRSGFCVVDHRNADDVRSARTLSGGETFLASLALALALADQVGELAAGGSARLDSIFLDEGFGSLDAETLDTVASAIEELGAAGRMVGIVTHVAELADRVPLRFVVTRGPSGSTVERVAT